MPLTLSGWVLLCALQFHSSAFRLPDSAETALFDAEYRRRLFHWAAERFAAIP